MEFLCNRTFLSGTTCFYQVLQTTWWNACHVGRDGRTGQTSVNYVYGHEWPLTFCHWIVCEETFANRHLCNLGRHHIGSPLLQKQNQCIFQRFFKFSKHKVICQIIWKPTTLLRNGPILTSLKRHIWSLQSHLRGKHGIHRFRSRQFLRRHYHLHRYLIPQKTMIQARYPHHRYTFSFRPSRL